MGPWRPSDGARVEAEVGIGRRVDEEEAEVTSGEEDEEEWGPRVAFRQYSLTFLGKKELRQVREMQN